jgi:hypothetical protein
LWTLSPGPATALASVVYLSHAFQYLKNKPAQPSLQQLAITAGLLPRTLGAVREAPADEPASKLLLVTGIPLLLRFGFNRGDTTVIDEELVRQLKAGGILQLLPRLQESLSTMEEVQVPDDPIVLERTSNAKITIGDEGTLVGFTFQIDWSCSVT